MAAIDWMRGRLGAAAAGGAEQAGGTTARMAIGLLVLRVALGADWIAHAVFKVARGMDAHAALLAKNGISPLLAWPSFGVELLGGIAIIVGFYARQWAALLCFFLILIVWIKWPAGWLYSSNGGGYEYALFWFAAQLAFVLMDNGAYSLKFGSPRFWR